MNLHSLLMCTWAKAMNHSGLLMCTWAKAMNLYGLLKCTWAKAMDLSGLLTYTWAKAMDLSGLLMYTWAKAMDLHSLLKFCTVQCDCACTKAWNLSGHIKTPATAQCAMCFSITGLLDNLLLRKRLHTNLSCCPKNLPLCMFQLNESSTTHSLALWISPVVWRIWHYAFASFMNLPCRPKNLALPMR